MQTRSTFTTLTTAALLGLAVTACGTATEAHGSTLNPSDTPSHTRVQTTPSVSRHQSHAPAPVCAGVPACHLVATRDVNADGTADQIGWVQLSKTSVQIRVRTAPHHVVTSKKIDVTLWWGGGAWGGATRIDGAAGAEILVGSMQGAHTPMYTMLTFRNGHLVVEKSPSPLSPLWQVDAADGDYMGWWRHVSPSGTVTMTQKIASRIGSGSRFSGHDVTYTWTKGAWKRTSSIARDYPTGKAASVIAGFHVAGLGAFPGIK
jgi:hypothetical protein